MQNGLKKRQEDDAYLMSRVKYGDTVALGRLYIKYRAALIDYLAGIGNVEGWSEDLADDVFIRIWENRQSFRGDSAFHTYMFAIAGNIVREQNRQIQREDAAYRQLVHISNRNRRPPQPQAALLSAERIKSIEESMSSLPEKRRQALEMMLSEDISPESSAARAGCSYDAFCRRIHEARKQLKKLLKDLDTT